MTRRPRPAELEKIARRLRSHRAVLWAQQAAQAAPVRYVQRPAREAQAPGRRMLVRLHEGVDADWGVLLPRLAAAAGASLAAVAALRRRGRHQPAGRLGRDHGQRCGHRRTRRHGDARPPRPRRPRAARLRLRRRSGPRTRRRRARPGSARRGRLAREWRRRPAQPSFWRGLFVEGIIAANANDGIGVAGIDGRAKVLPVRALGRCGGTVEDVYEAMLWAAGARLRRGERKSGVDARNGDRVLRRGADAEGRCRAGTLPVYRFFNNPRDASQRFTVDLSVRRAMINGTWVPDGRGAKGAALCSAA